MFGWEKEGNERIGKGIGDDLEEDLEGNISTFYGDLRNFST